MTDQERYHILFSCRVWMPNSWITDEEHSRLNYPNYMLESAIKATTKCIDKAMRGW